MNRKIAKAYIIGAPFFEYDKHFDKLDFAVEELALLLDEREAELTARVKALALCGSERG